MSSSQRKLEKWIVVIKLTKKPKEEGDVGSKAF